jgi:hypothetical protein
MNVIDDFRTTRPKGKASALVFGFRGLEVSA